MANFGAYSFQLPDNLDKAEATMDTAHRLLDDGHQQVRIVTEEPLYQSEKLVAGADKRLGEVLRPKLASASKLVDATQDTLRATIDAKMAMPQSLAEEAMGRSILPSDYQVMMKGQAMPATTVKAGFDPLGCFQWQKAPDLYTLHDFVFVFAGNPGTTSLGNMSPQTWDVNNPQGFFLSLKPTPISIASIQAYYQPDPRTGKDISIYFNHVGCPTKDGADGFFKSWATQFNGTTLFPVEQRRAIAINNCGINAVDCLWKQLGCPQEYNPPPYNPPPNEPPPYQPPTSPPPNEPPPYQPPTVEPPTYYPPPNEPPPYKPPTNPPPSTNNPCKCGDVTVNNNVPGIEELAKAIQEASKGITHALMYLADKWCCDQSTSVPNGVDFGTVEPDTIPVDLPGIEEFSLDKGDEELV